MPEVLWRIAYYDGARDRSLVPGIFLTRGEAQREAEVRKAGLTDVQKAQGAHFSLVEPAHSGSFSKAVFRREDSAFKKRLR